MRMMMTVEFPVEPFNSLVREGRAGEIIGKILAELKPEAVYFASMDGKRGAYMIVDLASASDIPRYAEPFFLHFHASGKLTPVMLPEDLEKAGLAELGKMWG